MKVLINEEEKIRILNLYNSNKETISEQAWLRRLIGTSVDDLLKLFGDDAVKTFETTLSRALSKEINYIAKNGQTFLKSLSGHEIPMKTIEDATKLISKGKVGVDEVANLLPRQLADGSEFREVFRNSFKNTASKVEGAAASKLPLSNLGRDFMELATKSDGWISITNVKGNMSGWKFHIYADTLDEAAFLYEKLVSVANRYGAGMKVASKGMLNTLEKSALQKGKGVTLYLPSSVVQKNIQKEFLSDVQSAIKGYNKSGQIAGDKMITGNIGYRYELSKPINTSQGVDMQTYHNLYSANQGGSHNIPNNPDLFK